ncbi:phospholipid/glycerol acyltransferase [Catenovulum agarivorans DS-2]|uniref:L-ornithine N(alpha)-acyltransferase n=1 Tax=Catenovulum agarivorans DS-2 TaxID=1328313 RepID=W7QVW6_9ALTE|nr:GNAT family N-acyltransferase [Catenovulum agarivorans]EWH11873.1 phospholipid/glycerol acyltransferase [Catenovulum agarivorans DS-2]
MNDSTEQLSIGQFFASAQGRSKKLLIQLLDKLLGIKKLNQLYQQHGFAQLSGPDFLQAFVELFKLKISDNFGENVRELTNGNRPLIIVANHPLGGVDGVVLLKQLLQYSANVKVLANVGLSLFKPLHQYFIFTNPLKAGARGNVTSLRQCEQHLVKHGILVVFPAGRVSYYQADKTGIYDHPWNRSFVKLAQKHNADILPVHIQASNRKRFYFFGRVYFRFRLLMLVREMLASKDKQITMTIGNQLDVANLPSSNLDQQSALIKLLTYLQPHIGQQTWPQQAQAEQQALAPASDGDTMASEVATIAKHQVLLSYKNWLVLHAHGGQIPTCVAEIRRLREKTFRDWQEGSGQPEDGDDFDFSYQHLFIFDQQKQQIIGAYRMGQTDRVSPTYLTQMFDFSTTFVGKQSPCLEMGRSFIVSEYQRSHHALLLLFKGIGRFVCKYPQYQTLYGTVSLSRCYSPLSVYLIEQFLVKQPDNSALAKSKFTHPQLPLLTAFIEQYKPDIATLDWLIQQIEPDKKGLPVLVKQYHQLGAQFISLAIDSQFAQTPGLLLKVHLPATEQKWLKLYLGQGWQNYLNSAVND